MHLIIDYIPSLCCSVRRKELQSVCYLTEFGQIALDLENRASRIELKTNVSGAKGFSLASHRTFFICINRQNIANVDQFVYFRS